MAQPDSRKTVCVIDGQGGGIGSTIIKTIKAHFGESVEVIALGTNAIATAQMLKARANRGASGKTPSFAPSPGLMWWSGPWASCWPMP
jgi:hypothetical protein